MIFSKLMLFLPVLGLGLKLPTREVDGVQTEVGSPPLVGQSSLLQVKPRYNPLMLFTGMVFFLLAFIAQGVFAVAVGEGAALIMAQTDHPNRKRIKNAHRFRGIGGGHLEPAGSVEGFGDAVLTKGGHGGIVPEADEAFDHPTVSSVTPKDVQKQFTTFKNDILDSSKNKQATSQERAEFYRAWGNDEFDAVPEAQREDLNLWRNGRKPFLVPIEQSSLMRD